MRRSSMWKLIILLGVCSIGSGQVIAQDREAPPIVAAALIIKLAAFEKNISTAGEVFIYVLGSEEITEELKEGVGKSIGKSTLTRVEGGMVLPTEKPMILFIGDKAKLDMGTEYTRQNKILSMTGFTDLVAKGVTLGFGIGSNGKPSIKLNLNSTVLEDVSWNPAILKLAKTVK